MSTNPMLIVMLTQLDRTVRNAFEIFDSCKNSRAKIWGFKDEGLPVEQMQALFAYIKSCGKQTALEVVAYTEHEGLQAAKLAKDCGCDYLMGTCFFDSIHDFCKENSIRYLPFAGQVEGRPSVLNGSIDEIVKQAQNFEQKGVDGIDLLGYRYTGDARKLNREIVQKIDIPVCIAGSIDTFDRLDEILEISPWAFTIGGAFFENKFGADFAEQIDRVIAYIEKDSES